MSEWAWFGITAGGLAVVLSLVFLALLRRPAAPRLDEQNDPLAGPLSGTNLILGDMTEILAGGLPGEERDREEILPEMARAGMYGRNALVEYRAVRAVLILTPLFAAAAVALLVAPPQIPYVAIAGLVLAVLGYSLPRVYVTIKAQSRTREVERGLPVFADLVSIALLAGQGLLGALRRVTAQLKPTFPRLAEELEIVIRQTELYNLSLAFEQWANRSQSPDVRSLSLILTQAQSLGNDISVALMEYATNMRSGARQRAEAKAQRASFWMIFPTIFCLWIPAAVILAGPIIFEFANRREKARDAVAPPTQGRPIGKALDAAEQ